LGGADVMIGGGCGNRVNQDFQTRAKSHLGAPRSDDPSRLPRPFDVDRCGNILGEGSGAFVLESREYAEARGAKIYATIRGSAQTHEPTLPSAKPTGLSIQRAIQMSLQRAGLTPSDIGLLSPDGLGTVHEDRIEAEAIRKLLGDVPVSATKGNFGDLGSGAGAVELASAILSMQTGIIPPTRNHDKTAADCPINVVHGQASALSKPAILKINQTLLGRSFAVVLTK
jgi:3-oxoacyl-[acyl-carrier-protein] synthase II